MATQTQVRRAWAFGWSVAIVSVVNSLLVIFKEMNPATKALMKAVSGHHWVTHSIVVLILFLLIGVALGTVGAQRAESAATLNGVAVAIFTSTVIGGLIIAGFYLFH